jgi:cytosine deaminase
MTDGQSQPKQSEPHSQQSESPGKPQAGQPQSRARSQQRPQRHERPVRDSTPAEAPVLLSGARLPDGRIVDVRLVGPRIEAVGTAGSLSTDTATRVDLAGYLLLPAPAEPHAHLDSALTADGEGPPSNETDDVQRRVIEAALLQLGHGATALRTHVRIGDVQGLLGLEAVLQARRALRGLVELHAVAVPRVLTGAAGADGLAMLRDAVGMGAAVIGGCPDLDPDPAGYVEAVLEVAAGAGLPVDLHTEGDDPTRLVRLAAMAGGLRPGVAVGPCAGLARLPWDTVTRVAGQLAAAGVSVVCLPQGGCGALESARRAGAAPVRRLRAAGVRVAAGSGALRDLTNPVGRGDPLEAAFLLASQGECDATEAYDTVSAQARTVLGLPRVRIEAGFPAELLAVRAERVEAMLSLAYSRIVIHRGRLVSRTSAVREYTDTIALDLPRQARSRKDPA